MNTTERKLDAANKILGRFAVEIAILLQGKDTPHFDPAKLSAPKISVYNTDQLRFTGRKMDQKQYRHHTGFPGGLKEETLERLMRRDSRIALRHAVAGMLPKNRLRPRMMKNLMLYKGSERI
mgnify:CR=1 FL=1